MFFVLRLLGLAGVVVQLEMIRTKRMSRANIFIGW